MGFFWRGKQRHAASDPGPSNATDPERSESIHEDDASLIEEDDIEDGFSPLTVISVAVFAVSAVFFAVQRLWSAVKGREKEHPPRRARVLHLPLTPAHKRREPRGMMRPDCNLSFVVSEE